MEVLIIRQIEIEGPGLIDLYLDEQGIEHTLVNAQEGIPDHSKFSHVILLGGPMSANDDEDYIRDEIRICKERLDDDMKTLGICLGAQIIAKAAGGKITKCEDKEIGYYDVELTDAGMEDDLFDDFEQLFPVFQWHGENFELPKDATLLAIGTRCQNQAFRLGNSYGLQFHTEVTKDMISQWLDKYSEEAQEENIDAEFLLSDAPRMEKIYKDQIYRILKRFLK